MKFLILINKIKSETQIFINTQTSGQGTFIDGNHGNFYSLVATVRLSKRSRAKDDFFLLPSTSSPVYVVQYYTLGH